MNLRRTYRNNTSCANAYDILKFRQFCCGLSVLYVACVRGFPMVGNISRFANLMVPLVGNICTTGTNLITNGTIGN